jgi:hypothetical protein
MSISIDVPLLAMPGEILEIGIVPDATSGSHDPSRYTFLEACAT